LLRQMATRLAPCQSTPLSVAKLSGSEGGMSVRERVQGAKLRNRATGSQVELTRAQMNPNAGLTSQRQPRIDRRHEPPYHRAGRQPVAREIAGSDLGIAVRRRDTGMGRNWGRGQDA